MVHGSGQEIHTNSIPPRTTWKSISPIEAQIELWSATIDRAAFQSPNSTLTLWTNGLKSLSNRNIKTRATERGWLP
jgi:hypothetical protein